MSSLLSSTSFRSIEPLWHAKETKNDHFQVEGIITGWELHLKSIEPDQFVLSDEYSSSQVVLVNGDSQYSNETKVDFLDYSLGERITTIARKLKVRKTEKMSVTQPSFFLSDTGCLLPQKYERQVDCKFCGCQIGNDVVHIFRPKPTVAAATGGKKLSDERGGWQGWIEWRLDDGTSTCKVFGGEEVFIYKIPKMEYLKKMDKKRKRELCNL